MCRKYPEIGGKIFVTENSGIGPKKLLLIEQIIFLQSHFNWWDKTYKIIPRRAFQFVSRIFLESPHKKTLSIPHTNMCLMLRTKNFRNKTLDGKYRIVGKCDIGQVFAISPIALVVAQLGNARKGALSL